MHIAHSQYYEKEIGSFSFDSLSGTSPFTYLSGQLSLTHLWNPQLSALPLLCQGVGSSDPARAQPTNTSLQVCTGCLSPPVMGHPC